MITTLVAIAVFVVYALNQAELDKGGKPNDQHAPDWQERAGVALFVAGGLTLMHRFYLVAYHDAAIEFGVMAWRFLGLCVVAYGAFTPVFRWRLNRLRGKDARYISPSNDYDALFIRLSGRGWLGRAHEIEYHNVYYSIGGGCARAVHRAGTWAYAVEVLALLIGCGITLAH